MFPRYSFNIAVPVAIDLEDKENEHEASNPMQGNNRIFFLMAFFILIKLRIVEVEIETFLIH